MKQAKENIDNPEKWTLKVYFFALILLAFALPLSMYLMSIAQFILIGSWIAGGKFKEKFQTFTHNKIALSITSIFALHLIGLAYTSNFSYALDDLRIKLPLLILPLVLSTSQKLTDNQFKIILYFFIGGIIMQSAMAMYQYFQINVTDNIDTRDLISSISHIRFGLMLVLGIFISGGFIFEKKSLAHYSFFVKFLFALLMLWLFSFMFILEAVTAILITIVVVFSLIFIWFIRQPKIIYGILGAMVIFFIPISMGVYLNKLYHDWFVPPPPDVKSLELYTGHNNPYYHNPSLKEVENGNYVQIYVSLKEMREEWNKRSELKFDQKDNKGQLMKLTLMRYLTSKGYRKDAEGVNCLSDEEITAIENGIANEMYMHKSSIQARLHQILWELNMFFQNGNPNEHSLLQRFEYIKASLGMIGMSPIVGVGTGDIRDAFTQYYTETKSRLKPQWQNRSHNQYLSIGAAFGIIGMIWFVLALFYPLTYSFVRKDFLYIVFFIIVTLSMLSEDTLETQAGITFFTFFQCLFLLGKKEDSVNASS
jgi:hypothetical protein